MRLRGYPGWSVPLLFAYGTKLFVFFFWLTSWQNRTIADGIFTKYELPHDKTNILTCAPSEDRSAWASTQSDQSDQSSLCAQWVAKDPSYFHADSEDADQTGRMPRLIWVFAGRTCHFVGFVTRRLIIMMFIDCNKKWIWFEFVL